MLGAQILVPVAMIGTMQPAPRPRLVPSAVPPRAKPWDMWTSRMQRVKKRLTTDATIAISSCTTPRNSLDMMFAFPNVFTDHPDGYYIKIVRHYAGGTAKEETYSYANEQWTVTTGYIYFTYTGLSAKEMCDKIEVTLCTANGDAISVTWVDSIRDYAMRLLDKHKLHRAILVRS